MAGQRDEDRTAWTRRAWDKEAPRYDRAIRFFERSLFAGGREWVCAQASGEVLEVGVGTGRNLPFYPPDVRLTGIDLSPGMLAVAADRVQELGLRMELREGDAQALPFPDAAFDTAVCTLSLCSIPDHRAAVREMYRVLRPGGRVLLLDHVASDYRVLRGFQRLLEKLTLRLDGDHQTRRPLAAVVDVGFVIERRERRKAGVVERLAARKPGPI